MRKRWKLPCSTLLASIFVGALWHGGLQAQSPAKVGVTLEAKTPVKLRVSPPSQKFLFIVTKPGEEIATIKEGDKIQIEDVKEIAVPFGKDIWVKGRTEKGDTGWVYYGEKDKPVNFLETMKLKE